MEIEQLKISKIIPYSNNAKEHNKTQIDNVAKSIQKFGLVQPLVVDKDNVLIIGHCRLYAARQLKMTTVPVVRADTLTEDQVKQLRLLDNKLNESDWDYNLLTAELDGLDMTDFDLDWGIDDIDTNHSASTETHEKLSDRFIISPFSILDARRGEWVERKRIWRAKIGDEGQARDVTVIGNSMNGYIEDNFANASILDPVLSEVICKWFALDNSKVFDVFAGDTVFGYVSSALGHSFTGIELREEQAAFNNARTEGLNAHYICDDGRNVLNHIAEKSQDLLFSCPPYFDLEVYSDKENDASNQGTYEEFYAILDTAFSNAVKCLKDDRFAVIVVGDIRNKKSGGYYGFPDDIKATFKRNGLHLLNELILIDPVGTARLRASKYMDYRKVAKVHQNVLVFYKGNPQKINKVFPRIEVDYDSEDMELE